MNGTAALAWCRDQMSSSIGAPNAVRVVVGHTHVGGGASLQLGAVARVRVDHRLPGVDLAEMTAWLEENAGHFEERELDRLVRDVARGLLARAALGALGVVFDTGYDSYQAATAFELTAADTRQQRFLDAFERLSDRPLRLSSEIEVLGTSMTPKVVGVFVRVARAEFASGRTGSFLDLRNPVAAGSDGDTDGVLAPGEQVLDVERSQ